MKLDEFLPEYNVRSQHSIEVHAIPAEVYAALTAGSFSQIPVVRFLMRLRGFPPERTNMAMRESLRRGEFSDLCDSPLDEIAYGIVGQFWRPSGGRKTITSPGQFAAFAQSSYAKAAWSFVLTASPLQLTQLRTETRIRPYDRGAHWKFRIYWLVVAPFSDCCVEASSEMCKRRAERFHQPAVARA